MFRSDYIEDFFQVISPITRLRRLHSDWVARSLSSNCSSSWRYSERNDNEVEKVAKQLFTVNKWAKRRGSTGGGRGGERVECWSNLSGDEKISVVRTCERWMHRNNEYHLIAFLLSSTLFLLHTLTPNFPHFNPNPADSPTVRLRIYGRPRI